MLDTPDRQYNPPIPVAEPARVMHDLLCIHCGYNLRTLLVDSICPECASPVRASLAAERQATWFQQIRRGTTWLVAAWLWSMLLVLMWLPAMLELRSLTDYTLVLYRLWQGSSILVPVCVLVGVLKITTRRGQTRPLPRLQNLRTLLRVFAPAIIVVAVLRSVYDWLLPPNPRFLFPSILLLLDAGMTVCLALYIGRIADKRWPTVARLSRVWVGVLIAYAVIAGGNMAVQHSFMQLYYSSATAFQSPPDYVMQIWRISGFVTLLADLICNVVGLVVLLRFRSMLGLFAKQAPAAERAS